MTEQRLKHQGLELRRGQLHLSTGLIIRQKSCYREAEWR